jgi:hypothetical protein
MKRELGLLNIICLLVVLGFLAMALISVLSSGDFLTTDNLFIITVSLVMALMFVVPLLQYLNSQGKLPIPFVKKQLPAANVNEWNATGSRQTGARQLRPASTPPLLDAKGRAVPPDVKAIMSRFNQSEAKDA